MSAPLSPQATNIVECSECGWKRILDPLRSYRGGHTHLTHLTECHGVIVYSEVSPQPPEIYVLDEAEAYESIEEGPTQQQLDDLAAVYELEGNDVDTTLAAAAAS